MFLETDIDFLPKTSSITIRRLKSIGINTYNDLLNYFPFRYEDYTLISPINKLQAGEIATILGQIIEAKNVFTRSGLKIQIVTIDDGTGNIKISWFNQPFLIKFFKKGQFISLAGETKWFGRQLTIEPKSYQLIDSSNPDPTKLIHTGKFIPIYPEKNGLSSRLLREKMIFVLSNVIPNSFWDPNKNNEMLKQVQHDKIVEIFPTEIISFNKLMDESEAYQQIHFPDNLDLANKARERLSFNELFSLQLAINLIKKSLQKEKVGNRFTEGNGHDRSLQQFIANLPFKLTNDQNKVIKEIITDLKKITPMNRFLQGEVGSGKTVVAAIACYLSFLNGYQSLIMAPTEILAKQHYLTIQELFKKLETRNSKLETISKFKIPKIGIQTKSKKISDFGFRISDFDIIVGTHALLDKRLFFNNVGLIIIDEQHRFGVGQRTELRKKGVNPHLLTMTATPIPRTIALTLYGDLDVSYIEEMPKNRLLVKTYFVPKEKRLEGYHWIKQEIIQKKIQVFIICPLIEESDKETMSSVKAAIKEFQYLKSDVFNQFKVGLLHGRLKPQEKDKVMTMFRNKNYDILVATSVVEVGIDISNATVMIIEGAERYGLAQLHQLRGRVGRGNQQSYCFLYTEKQDESIIKRLKFFAMTNSGIHLAEYDFNHRGPGEIFGTKQHGFIDLKIAKLTDYFLIKQTKNAVDYFLKNYSIDDFPGLKKKVKDYNVKQVTNN